MQTYAHPETLVSTAWTAEHATDPGVRVAEVDVDTKAYQKATSPARSAGPGTRSCATPFAATFCPSHSLKS